MNAYVKVFTVAIGCPKCDEDIPEPKTGSFFWSIIEEIPADVTCPHCNRTLKVKLPKDTK